MSNDNPPADEAFADHRDSESPMQQNLKSGATWTRLLFMVISCVLLNVAMIAGVVVVVLGFCWVLFTGEVNLQVRQAGQSIATYAYNIARYLTYNTDERPFPLGGDWPTGADAD